MERNTQGKLLKTTFSLVLVILGILVAFKELYISKQTSIQPNEMQVLAASTFKPVENMLPALQQRVVTSATSSASLNQTLANFEVSVPVLMYHRIRDVLLVTDRSDIEFSVAPSSLEDQLRYLHEEGYITLTLNELSDSLENRTPLPSKSVILTFDDGFRDFYTNAFPLLKKYNLRAVNFYVAGYSNFPGYMDTAMLSEIHQSGLVDVQPHSMSHLLLSKLQPDEARREIFESKRLLEETLGKRTNYFAYPYGDYNPTIVGLVSEAGFKLGFGTTPGVVLKSTEKLILPRISITGFDNLEKFKVKLGVKEDQQTNTDPTAKTETKETTTSAKPEN